MNENEMSPEVSNELFSVLDEQFHDPPPPHAFTLRQYYAEYCAKMKKSGREDDVSEMGVIRSSLNKMVATGKLESSRWPQSGTSYFWKPKEPPE